jgi:hypothetical protein
MEHARAGRRRVIPARQDGSIHVVRHLTIFSVRRCQTQSTRQPPRVRDARPNTVDSTPCLGFRAFDPLTNRRRAARTPQNRREYSTGTAKSPCPPRRNGHCCGCRPPAMQRCVPLAHARGTPEKNLWHRCHKNSMISSSIFLQLMILYKCCSQLK